MRTTQMERRRGAVVDQRGRRRSGEPPDGDAMVGATLGSDAGDQQDATSANSSDFGEPPTRTTSEWRDRFIKRDGTGSEKQSGGGSRWRRFASVDTRAGVRRRGSSSSKAKKPILGDFL
ncbi:hypothetical protein Scep_000847 [Stephania cephalantha]|uniref:Uncharacterized protein n=1 Tax=Stephania cephalantha TaxID=152367 RepID=A0AAP0Q746_9MAGN